MDCADDEIALIEAEARELVGRFRQVRSDSRRLREEAAILIDESRRLTSACTEVVAKSREQRLRR